MSDNNFCSADGTMLAAYHEGEGEIPVVLANGLGGPYEVWKPLTDHLSEMCSFYSWDYRGLYRSEAPSDRNSLTVENAVEDQLAMMKYFGLERVLIGGWSMGVQVALEFYRRYPELVMGMFLMNGTYGNIFNTAFRRNFSSFILPPAIRVLQQMAPVTGALIRAFARWPHTLMLASSLGLVDPRLGKGRFREVAGKFGSMDMDLYFESLLRLSKHNAEDILPSVNVPVLIIAGERDLMTPPEVTGKMLEELPDAELYIVPDGSHYCLLEYTDLVTEQIRLFLEEFSCKK